MAKLRLGQILSAPFGALGGVVGNKTSAANQLQKMSEGISPVNPSYEVSPYAKQRLSLAEILLNARMPGATNVERNIYTNQANQVANINKNATDSSQALALGANAYGQTGQQLSQLGQQESQDYYNRLQNLSGAQQGMISEEEKVYHDRLRDYQEKMGLKNAYLAAGMQNKQGVFNDILGFGIQGLGLGLGGFGGGFGGGGGGGGFGFGGQPSGGGYYPGWRPGNQMVF